MLINKQIQPLDISGTFKRAFTATLRAPDPFWRGDLSSQYLSPTVVTELGRSYDRSYDLGYTHLMDASGSPAVASNTLVASNDGNYRTPIKITFTGAMSGIRLVNARNGEVLAIRYPILAGDTLSVDTLTGRTVDGAGARRTSYLNPTSDFIKLEPGDNTLSLGVSSFGAGARMDVEFSPRWMI